MAYKIYEKTLAKALAETSLKLEFGFIRDSKPSERWYRDVYCADGVIERGFRIIKPGGRIKFGGVMWKDESLMPLVGNLVGVCYGDCFCTDINVYWINYPNREPLMSIALN